MKIIKIRKEFLGLCLILAFLLLIVFAYPKQLGESINSSSNDSADSNNLVNVPNSIDSSNLVNTNDSVDSNNLSNLINSSNITIPVSRSSGGGGGGSSGGSSDSSPPIDFNPSSEYPLHNNITVTFFWVGEPAGKENRYISNTASAWDENWQEHYGGIDSPYNRSEYLPSGFVPKENPFYFALPYNDFDDNGERRENAENIYWYNEKNFSELESMCKNRWIKITKENKTAYAQWEDVGPFNENDVNYVFGEDMPENEINNNAGLDVSPAVRDYLNLQDIDAVDWQFVNFSDVPEGPWRQIITTSQIFWN